MYNIWISKYVYSCIYIETECLHTKNIGPSARATYMVQKSAHQPIKKVHTIRGPLRHPQLPLPQEAVVAHPHLPQAVVVAHPQDHPAQAAGVHSS
jgi:hypothetical protein